MADQISKSTLALTRARVGEAEWRNSGAGGGTHWSALALENMADQISESALTLARAGAGEAEWRNLWAGGGPH